MDFLLTQKNYVFSRKEQRARTLFLVNKTISKINNDKLILKTCYFLDSTLLNIPDIYLKKYTTFLLKALIGFK